MTLSGWAFMFAQIMFLQAVPGKITDFDVLDHFDFLYHTKPRKGTVSNPTHDFKNSNRLDIFSEMARGVSDVDGRAPGFLSDTAETFHSEWEIHFVLFRPLYFEENQFRGRGRMLN